MTDLSLLNLVLTATSVGAGLVVVALVLRAQTIMLSKMIDILVNLIDKLGDTIAENRQTSNIASQAIEELNARKRQ